MKTIPFDKLKPGMYGEDYNKSPVVIVKVGNIHDLKDFFIGGQNSYDEMLEQLKEADLDPFECVAVMALSEEFGMDFEVGDTYVYVYGGEGVTCPYNTVNTLLLRP